MCRKQSEYELRRVERHLAQVEVKERAARFAVDGADSYVRPSKRKAVKFWQAERQALEGRLRELLGQSSTENDAAF